MKRVRSDVAHVWAHKLQSDARNQTGSLYFQGDTIYSYGSHFPMARHVTDKDGRAVILFTTRSYSMTTSGHLSQVRRAIPPDVKVFHVERPDREPDKEMLEDYGKRIQEAELKLARARTGLDYRLGALNELIAEANEFSRAFRLRRRFDPPANQEALKEKARLSQQRERETRKKAAAKRQEEMNERLRRETGDNTLVWEDGCHYMRVSADGALIQTTGHANITVDEARAILPQLVEMLREGRTYQANGVRLMAGPYLLQSIDERGYVRVGCHKFAKGEVLRIAGLLGISA